MSEHVKNWFDAAFIGTAVATLANTIPILIGLLSLIWGVYRIYDLHLAIKLKKQRLNEGK